MLPLAAQPGGRREGDIVPLTFRTQEVQGYNENDFSGD